MVKSINEPLSTAEVSTDMPQSPNELPAMAAVVVEDGSTVFNGEVLPSGGTTEQAETATTSAPDKVAPTPPLGLLSPVDESGLTEFIAKSGKPN